MFTFIVSISDFFYFYLSDDILVEPPTTAIKNEVEESTTRGPNNPSVPVPKPTSPRANCVSLDANDSLSNVVSDPIIDVVAPPSHLTADFPRIEIEGESQSPMVRDSPHRIGSAQINYDGALNPLS